MDTINDLLTGSLVEWQGIDEHIAKSGKIKHVLKGIPTDRFWRVWKACKAELRASGVTVWAERLKVGQGEFATHKGICREKTRKQWEVSVWVNKRNHAAILAAGYQIPEERPVDPANCPF